MICAFCINRFQTRPGHLGDLINNYLEILTWKLTKLMSVQVTVTGGVARVTKIIYKTWKKGKETAPPPSFKLMNDTCECALKQINKTKTKKKWEKKVSWLNNELLPGTAKTHKQMQWLWELKWGENSFSKDQEALQSTSCAQDAEPTSPVWLAPVTAEAISYQNVLNFFSTDPSSFHLLERVSLSFFAVGCFWFFLK